MWQVTKEHFLKAREKTAWSTYILRAHGCGGEPLIQMIGEGGKKKGGGEILQMLNVIQLSLK